ncbi:MAG TPA: SH3 domain-containing protein [Bacillota bacterium]|nr:SH3 domain-containing protein [Bacillota bacterium]
MASIRDLARELLVAEEPLAGSYRELRSAAVTQIEQALSGHLEAAQASQVALLGLMCDELPNKFLGLGTITSQAVKLRDGPGGSHPVLLELGAGTPVIVMEWQGYWAHVQLPGGRRGYVFRDYVRTDAQGRESPTWQKQG